MKDLEVSYKTMSEILHFVQNDMPIEFFSSLLVVSISTNIIARNVIREFFYPLHQTSKVV